MARTAVRLCVFSCVICFAHLTKPDRRRSGTNLQFLRIAKSASRSLLDVMIEARDRQPDKCAGLAFTGSHALTRNQIDAALPVFVVLREPCERFLSIFYGLRESGKVSKKHGLDQITPLDWARRLLETPGLRRQFSYIGNSTNDFDTTDHGNLRLSWKQSTYFGEDGQHSLAACLPTFLDDAQSIVLRFLPGCKLVQQPQSEEEESQDASPPHAHLHEYNRTTTAELCELVGALYPEDVALYQRHCAAKARKRTRSLRVSGV